eukprot:12877352-Ditylum_brightwellii.AAC.1
MEQDNNLTFVDNGDETATSSNSTLGYTAMLKDSDSTKAAKIYISSEAEETGKGIRKIAGNLFTKGSLRQSLPTKGESYAMLQCASFLQEIPS